MTGDEATRVISIGSALPGEPHGQREIAERMIALHGLAARDARKLRAFTRRTRIERRHSVLADDWSRPGRGAFFVPGEPPPSTDARMRAFAVHAPPLALDACRRALAPDAPWGRVIAAESIDHLIVVSCTGFLAPGLDVHLIRALGLRDDVGRSLLGFQGCHAGLSALRLATDVARARTPARVLVVCVELSSLHFQHRPTRQNVLANALFADGAAAAVVASGAGTPARGPILEVRECETRLFPEGEEAMTWRVGDRGFELGLGERLPELLARHVPPCLEAGDVKGAALAFHPGGAAILDALARALALPEHALDVSRAVLREVGNLSSATIFLVLDETVRRCVDAAPAGGTPVPVLAAAFGPGLTLEIARLRLTADGRQVRSEEDACAPGRTSPGAAPTPS